MDTRTSGVEPVDTLDDMEETVEVDAVDVRRGEIERTRADIGQTLEAIKDKLQPQQLIQQAKASAQEVTADVAQKAREAVREAVHDAKESAQEVTADVAEKAREAVREAVHDAREMVQEAKDAIPEAAHNAVSSAVDTAKDAVSDAVDHAKDAVGSAMGSARDAGSNIMDTFRQNPIPYTLIGLGLSWLYWNARQSAGRRRHQEHYFERDYRYMPGGERSYNSEFRYPSTPPGAGYNAPSVRQNLGELRYQQTESSTTQGGTLHVARERDTPQSGTLHAARERVGDAVDAVQSHAGEVVDRVQDTVSHLGDQARDHARYAAHGFQRTLEENPLVIGAVALGLGAAIGFLLPNTRQENRIMGEARERLVENVQQTAHEVVEKVQSVAGDAMDTARDKAREEGLTQS